MPGRCEKAIVVPPQVNLFDIYNYTMQLQRTVDRANGIVLSEKRKGKYEAKHLIPDNKTIKMGDFIEAIAGWLKYKGWMMEDELGDIEQLILETVKEYPYELLFLKDGMDDLIGKDGYAGTIDKINEDTGQFQQMHYMIKIDDDKYQIIVEAGVNIEADYDRDYFSVGNENLLFLMMEKLENGDFEVDEVNYLDTCHKTRLEKLMVIL